MKIRREDRGAVTVLHLEGTLTGGPDAARFGEAIEELVGEERLLCVFDFEHVNFINSPAIGYIAHHYAHYVRAGGEVVACRITGKVALVYELFLRRLFECFDRSDHAAEALVKRNMAERG